MEQAAERRPKIGVLAMQGAFEAHVAALNAVGAEAFEIRTSAQLTQAEGIVLPGGESTAIRKALVRCGLYDSLRAKIERGTPTLATCAGLILLGRSAPDGAPATYGVLDLELQRNGFGRQPHSFQGRVALELPGDDHVHEAVGSFIRAPRILALAPEIEVLGRLSEPVGPAQVGEVVAVRQGNIIGLTWHPELEVASPIHRWFAQMVAGVACQTISSEREA